MVASRRSKGMGWKFWQKSGYEDVPESIQARLVSEWGVERSRLERLRCVKGKRKFAGRSVKSFKIIEIGQVDNPASQLDESGELDGQQRNGVLFEGFLESDGSVQITSGTAPQVS